MRETTMAAVVILADGKVPEFTVQSAATEAPTPIYDTLHADYVAAEQLQYPLAAVTG